MDQNPPPWSQQAGWPAAGAKTRQSLQFYSVGAAASPDPGRIRITKTVAQFVAARRSGRI